VVPSARHRAADAVDLRHRLAQVQRDAVARIPGQRVEDDLVERLLAGQHRRQQDAVVVGVRLGAEDGDVVEVRRDAQQLLQRAHAGHAVADHHELQLVHGRSEGREGVNEHDRGRSGPRAAGRK
jgi:hypothetical protein